MDPATKDVSIWVKRRRTSHPYDKWIRTTTNIECLETDETTEAERIPKLQQDPLDLDLYYSAATVSVTMYSILTSIDISILDVYLEDLPRTVPAERSFLITTQSLFADICVKSTRTTPSMNIIALYATWQVS